MKISFSILVCFIAAQLVFSQQYTSFDAWVEFAKNDVSLQPEYGNEEKSEEQKTSDKKFVDNLLQKFKNDSLEISYSFSDLGFQYLYERGDLETAMRRFNQAYLVTQKNPDIYYGYGAIYFNLGSMEEARKQYDKALAIDSTYARLLTDYATTYLTDYYDAKKEGKTAWESLFLAREYLEKSFKIDPSNSNTVYKLSLVTMHQGVCKKAKDYYKMARKMKNENINKEFQNELNETCSKSGNAKFETFIDASNFSENGLYINEYLLGLTSSEVVQYNGKKVLASGKYKLQEGVDPNSLEGEVALEGRQGLTRIISSPSIQILQ